jgi:hypothetical protein
MDYMDKLICIYARVNLGLTKSLRHSLLDAPDAPVAVHIPVPHNTIFNLFTSKYFPFVLLLKTVTIFLFAPDLHNFDSALTAFSQFFVISY